MPETFTKAGRSYLLLVVLAGGFLAGVAIPDDDRGEKSSRPNSTATAEIASPAPRPVPIFKQAISRSSYRSSDTLDDLLELSEDEVFPRLALWLVDAQSDDFDACWHALTSKENPNTRLLDLLFLHWTALDPRTAIHAAAGSKHAHIPWWAWAKNDPQQAFDHAKENQPDQLGAVLRGIGQSDGELALRLLDAHPEINRNEHLTSILEGLSRTDPAAAAKLAFEAENFAGVRPLQAWLREDPHEALAWFYANRDRDTHSQYSKAFVAELERESPERLPELIATLPAGNLRRQFEAAAFRQLAREDPEVALRQARENASSKPATEMLAHLATAALREDPARSLEIFAEVVDRSGGQSDRTRIYDPDGLGASSWRRGPTDELLQNLALAQPAAAMETAIAAHGWSQIAGKLAEQWAQVDREAYSAWAQNLKQPELRTPAMNLSKNRTD